MKKDLSAYDDPEAWPALLARAERTAKKFASANKLPYRLSLQQYKELAPNRPLFVYLYFAP
jgi:hypothetical protein